MGQLESISVLKLLEGCTRASKMHPLVRGGKYQVLNGAQIPIIAAFIADETLLERLAVLERFIVSGATILVAGSHPYFNKSCGEVLGGYALHVSGQDSFWRFDNRITGPDRVVLVQEGASAEVLGHELAHDLYFVTRTPWQRWAFTSLVNDCITLADIMMAVDQDPIYLNALGDFIKPFYEKYGSPFYGMEGHLFVIQLKDFMQRLLSLANFSVWRSVAADRNIIFDEHAQFPLEIRRCASEIFAQLAIITSIKASVEQLPYPFVDYFRQSGLYD